MNEGAEPPPAPEAAVVRLIGAGYQGAVESVIARAGGTVVRRRPLAEEPYAVELGVVGIDLAVARAALAADAATRDADAAVVEPGWPPPGPLLVVLDVDSTLIEDEVIELLADHAGSRAQVELLTEAAMRGEIDFEQSLRARVATLAGTPESALHCAQAAVRLTPGARRMVAALHGLGHRVGVVSGGFAQLVDPLARELGLDHAEANQLEVVDGHLTGDLVGPVVDRSAKEAALRRYAERDGIPLSRTVAVGDGANDLDMMAAAALGVAFCAKPAVRAVADARVTQRRLDVILHLLGFTHEEVERALGSEPAVS